MHLQVVRELIHAGAPVDQRDARSSITTFYDSVLDEKANKEEKLGGHTLHRAARSGHDEVVRLLLQHEADIHAVDKANDYGRTALHVAAACGHETTLQLLLDNNAGPTSDAKGITALHEAAANENIGVLSILLDHIGEHVSAKSWMVTARLNDAVDEGNANLVRVLLEEGADPDNTNRQGIYPLHRAVAQKNDVVLELLLKSGAGVDSKEDDSWTPLNWAVYMGYEEGVRLLLKHDANIEILYFYDSTPLHIALGYGAFSKVKLLLDHGARLGTEDKNATTALRRFLETPVSSRYAAMKRGAKNEDTRASDTIAILELLLELGAVFGRTTIHQAIKGGNRRPNAVRWLLEKDANPLVVDDLGYTALWLTVAHREADVVRVLLNHGVDINERIFMKVEWEKRWVGATVLHRAAWRFHAKEGLVRLLLDAGPNIEARNAQGYTAWALAVTSGSVMTVDILLSYGANIDAPCGPNGETAVLIAAYKGHVALLQHLRRKGACVTAEDSNGFGVMDWAKKGGDEATIFFLESFLS